MDNPYSAPQTEIYTATSAQAAPLTWKQILFSLEGRIPRRTYWGASILVGLVQFAVAFALSYAFGGNHELVIGTVAWILTLWPTIAIGAKRWHDRGKSGWWNLVILIQAVTSFFLDGLNAMAVISVIAIFWILIECGCLRGTEGPNKYGEDPR